MVDFLVIGGGIAGISAGARLSEHGNVTVLEAEDALGYHASGRSAALFEPGYGPVSVNALSHAGAAFLHAEAGGYLTPRGLILLGRPDQAELFKTDLASFGMQQIPVAKATEDIPILNPETVAFAGVNETAFDIDTDRLIQDFARTIRANGGQVLPRQRVTGIRSSKDWVVTATEEFTAKVLVNAAGPWVDEIARMAGIDPIGITPRRRSMARIPAPGGHDLRHWPMMIGAGESWYAKPDAGKLLVSPADAEPTTPHDAYADDMVLAEGLARYEEMVSEPVTRVESNWAGLRSFAPDGTLVLGPDPADPTFIWSAGQGGYGFQTAPAASQLVADLTVGQQSTLDASIVAQLTPNRLRK